MIDLLLVSYDDLCPGNLALVNGGHWRRVMAAFLACIWEPEYKLADSGSSRDVPGGGDNHQG